MESAEDFDGQLYRYVQESCTREESFHFLQFEFLQRVNIAHLQSLLATLKSRVHEGKSCTNSLMSEVQQTLHAYASAIRDYSELHSCMPLSASEERSRSLRLERNFPQISRLPGRPFDSHYVYLNEPYMSATSIDSLRTLLSKNLPTRLTYSSAEKSQRRHEFEQGKPPHGISAAVDRAVRFIVAVTSGLFLLVPMIIMLLAPGRNVGLVTVCCAVLLFAVSLAFGVRASNVETMVATATYAAVLVVFIGANTGGPT